MVPGRADRRRSRAPARDRMAGRPMIRNVPPVPTCHPDRRMEARGLCSACYQADRRAQTHSRIVRAIEAGEDVGDRPELLGQAFSPRELEALVLYGRIGSQKIVAAEMGLSV